MGDKYHDSQSKVYTSIIKSLFSVCPHFYKGVGISNGLAILGNSICNLYTLRKLYFLSWESGLTSHHSHFGIDPFPIRRATSVPLGEGTKFALHHGKMSTTKRRAVQILHISTFQFTFKCGYNNFISKYTDINSLHVTQNNLLHNNTCYST